jgi:Rrf2 family nitric oxide-sensitive transcriptional repressor
MQLTQFSDFSLRVALYLGAHPNRTVSLVEISRAYGISQHHLVKVTQRLVEHGIVSSVRGRNGGLRLGRRPAEISVGQLLRLTEPHFNLVECFDRERNTCPIDRACGLKNALFEAQRAFLQVLDGYTLADFLPRAPSLIQLWKGHLEASVPGSPPPAHQREQNQHGPRRSHTAHR